MRVLRTRLLVLVVQGHVAFAQGVEGGLGAGGEVDFLRFTDVRSASSGDTQEKVRKVSTCGL